MASTPSFASTPKASAVVLAATADTSRTAPTTVGTVFTAGASGSRIDEVWITGVSASTTANQVRLFLYNGTTYYLLKEVLITAITASASVSAFTTTVFFSNLVLPSGWSLRATTNNAESYAVTALGGDF